MPEKLILLKAFGNSQEAELARGFLEAHGIPVVLGDEHAARLGLPLPVGGTKLQVRESDLAAAEELLADAAKRADPSDNSGRKAKVCPACGGVRTARYITPRQWLFAVLLLGIPLLLMTRQWRCQLCGHVWSRANE